MNKHVFFIVTLLAILTMRGFSQEKKHGIELAMSLMNGWNKSDVFSNEKEILNLEDIDALRIIAFMSRSAAYPEKAENVSRDEKLNKIFWASVEALGKISTDDSKATLQLIRNSGLVKGGDLLIFSKKSLMVE